MRPGQGQRRGGRRNENRHGGHGGGNGGGHRSQGGQGQGQNRSAQSLRNQIFDSNGPDMRVRGNAFQVHEKYQALAKDALSSGDRVLAENYLQHAEHYYRIIEAINEATAAEQRARQASWESQPQPQQYGADGQPQTGDQPQMGLSQDGQPQDANGNGFGGNQDAQYQNNGQQGQGNNGNNQGQQDGQQNFRRNRDNRDNRRDGNRDNYSNNRNQQRYGNPDNRGNQAYDQNQSNAAQHNQVEYAPHNQTQQQGRQSQDPLYDGVDEDIESPDTQAAVGGRR